MLRSIFEASGYQVHRYTSPHLLSIKERILLAGHPIEEKELWTALDSFRILGKKYDLSWFEFLTGIAFKFFSEIPADILLLETGLGGEFDATNVVPAPLACLLTPISYDHRDFLGPTLTEITHAKGGILKPGTLCLSTQQPPETIAILKEKTHSLEVPFFVEGTDWSICQVKEQGMEFIWQKQKAASLPVPNLKGLHQIQNAGLVLATVELLKGKLPLTKGALEKGLCSIEWPGRLQLLWENPTFKIWFDVAHNQESAQALSNFFNKEVGEKFLVFALLKSKEIEETLRPLVNTFNHFFFFAPPEKERWHSAQTLANFVSSKAKKYTILPSLRKIKAILDSSLSLPQHLVIAGSHYFGQEALEFAREF